MTTCYFFYLLISLFIFLFIITLCMNDRDEGNKTYHGKEIERTKREPDYPSM